MGAHTGIIHEQLLTGPVHLTHDQIQLAAPRPILLAEPGVLLTLRVSLARLMP